MITFILFTLLACAIATPVTTYSDCSGGKGVVLIKSIDASPYPFKAGVNTTITASGTLTKKITEGTYTAQVTVAGFPISKSGDLCTLSDKFTCPQGPGDMTLSQTFAIPSFVPSGTISIHLSAVDGQQNTLFCFDITVTVGQVTPFPAIVPFSTVPFQNCDTGDFVVADSGLTVTP